MSVPAGVGPPATSWQVPSTGRLQLQLSCLSGFQVGADPVPVITCGCVFLGGVS